MVRKMESAVLWKLSAGSNVGMVRRPTDMVD